MRNYLLYLKCAGEKLTAHITPDFSVDRTFWQEQQKRLHVVGQNSSLAYVFYLRDVVNRYVEGKRFSPGLLQELRRLIRQEEGLLQRWSERECRRMENGVVREEKGRYRFSFEWLGGEDSLEEVPFLTVVPEKDREEKGSNAHCHWEQENGADEADQEDKVYGFLAGRALLYPEAEYVVQSKGWNRTPGLMSAFQRLVLKRRAELLPGVAIIAKQGGWKCRLRLICRRCGEEKREAFRWVLCDSCGQVCAYCTQCVGLGRSGFCVPLLLVPYAIDEALPNLPASVLSLGPLSPMQAQAAERARQFVERGMERERKSRQPMDRAFLIWAVCGAGKTEIVFPAIREALVAGGKDF